MSELKPNEFLITRLYDAPVKAVWEAWHNIEQCKQWWGPRGFTITSINKNLCAGGEWKYIMHGPDGVDYPNHTKYFEVIPHKLLVYDHGGNEEQPPIFRVTAEFNDFGSKTEMKMKMACSSAEAAAEIQVFIRQANGESTWDRLAEYLEKKLHKNEVFTISRSFHTSVEKLFSMWTDKSQFAKWMGPTGSSLEFMRSDIREGGSSFYKMSMTGGLNMYGRAEYKKIIQNEKLVYIQQFCDQNEKLSRHPMSSTWPESMLTTVEFYKEVDGNSRVQLRWQPWGSVSDVEMSTFTAARTGMMMGWTGSFDKLEVELLAKV